MLSLVPTSKKMHKREYSMRPPSRDLIGIMLKIARDRLVNTKKRILLSEYTCNIIIPESPSIIFTSGPDRAISSSALYDRQGQSNSIRAPNMPIFMHFTGTFKTFAAKRCAHSCNKTDNNMIKGSVIDSKSRKNRNKNTDVISNLTLIILRPTCF